jgi:hypothetical protein
VSLVDNPDQLRGALTPGKGGTACLLVDSGGETRAVARATLQIVVDAIKQIVGGVRGKTVLSSLPVAGIARIAASLAVLSQGATLLLPDPNERPDAGLDLHPADRVIFDVTSLDRLFRAWAEDIEAKSWVRKSVTRWSLRQGRSAQGRGWKHRLAEGLALRGLRAKLGGRAPGIDVFSEGGRRASDEVNAFFAASGLFVRYASPAAGTLLAR